MRLEKTLISESMSKINDAVKVLEARQTANDNLDELIEFEKWDSAYSMASKGLTEMPWLVDGLFPKTGLAVVYGSADTGKSTLLRQLCLCVVAGIHWVGYKTKPEHKRTAYISTEDDIDSLSVILPKQIKEMEYDKAHCKNIYFLFQAGDVHAELKALLEKGHKFDLVVIDCWSDIYNFNNSQANQVRVFLSNFNDLARIHKVLIIFNHHSKKEIEHKKPHKSNVSGVGLVSKSRLAIEFRNDPLDKELRHLCIVKGNYIQDDLKMDSVCLNFSSGFHFKPEANGNKPFEILAVSSEEKAQADENIYEYAQNNSQVETAEHFGVAQSSVSRAIKRHEQRKLYNKE